MKNFFPIQYLTHGLTFGIIVLASFTFAIFILFSFRNLAYSYPLDYGEGVVMNFSNLLYKHESYFSNINKYPYIHAAYPHLFPYLTGRFFPIHEPQLIIGRSVSFIATFLIVLILFTIFFEASKNVIFAFIFSALFVAPSFVIEWASLYRVDMLAIFLSLAGLCIYVRNYEKKSPFRYFSAIFFILAIFTKQNALAAPLSILLFLLFYDRKEFLTFASLYFLPLIVIFLYYNHVTVGQFYLHLVTYTNFFPLDFTKMFVNYKKFIGSGSILFVLFFANALWLKKNALFHLYFGISFILFITSAKPGANINFFIEPYLSLLLIAGLTFLRMRENINRHAFVAYSLIVIFIQIAILFPYDQLRSLQKSFYVPEGDEVRQTIDRYVKKARGPVLSEDLGYLAIHHLPVYLEPFQFSQLAKYHLWDETNLVKDCNQQKFTLIVAGTYISEIPGMKVCLARSYLLEKDVGYYKIYVPSELRE